MTSEECLVALKELHNKLEQKLISKTKFGKELNRLADILRDCKKKELIDSLPNRKPNNLEFSEKEAFKLKILINTNNPVCVWRNVLYFDLLKSWKAFRELPAHFHFKTKMDASGFELNSKMDLKPIHIICHTAHGNKTHYAYHISRFIIKKRKWQSLLTLSGLKMTQNIDNLGILLDCLFEKGIEDPELKDYYNNSKKDGRTQLLSWIRSKII